MKLQQLATGIHSHGNETWETKRERLDAEWTPLVDEYNRRVHGWAHIEELPEHMLGRTIDYGMARVTLSDKPFGVEIIATRDGKGYGAKARTSWHATREEAIAYAKKALVQQGKRYAKKYGEKS